MALINRISRLFRADLHAVLDRIEEPDALLRQAVREMEEDISNDERRLSLLQNEQAQLANRKSDIEQSLERLDGELDICFESKEEDLARSLVRRKLEAQRFNNTLERKRETLSSVVAELKQRLQQNSARLTAMQQKLELLVDTEMKSAPEDSWYPSDISIKVQDDEVEVAFLGEKQRRVSS